MVQASKAQGMPATPTRQTQGREVPPASKKEALRGLAYDDQVAALRPKDGGAPPRPDDALAPKKEPQNYGGIVMSGGEQMMAVQQALAAKGYMVGPINGINAGYTRAAVIQFQKDNGLEPADGIVGPKTLAALGLDVSGMEASPGIGQAPGKGTTKDVTFELQVAELDQELVRLDELRRFANDAKTPKAKAELEQGLAAEARCRSLRDAHLATKGQPPETALQLHAQAMAEGRAAEELYTASAVTQHRADQPPHRTRKPSPVRPEPEPLPHKQKRANP